MHNDKNKITQQLLGFSLGLVMVLGSVPLGFADEPTSGIIIVELSNMPKLNEVVTVTVNVLNLFDKTSTSANSEPNDTLVRIELNDSWEFVSVHPSQISSNPSATEDGEDYSMIVPLTSKFKETQTFAFQAKPTKIGINNFSVEMPIKIRSYYSGLEIPRIESVSTSLFVGENRTIPTMQYWEENPEKAPWNNEPTSTWPTTPDGEPIPKHPDEVKKTATVWKIQGTSLLAQLEQALEPNQIQCQNESHVLVVRPNDKLACISGTTAYENGWKAINNSIDKIIYDYPLSSKDLRLIDDTNTSSSNWPGEIEIIISNLPKINDTAEVTVIFTNFDKEGTLDFFTKGLSISPNLEFVNIGNHILESENFIKEPLKILSENESEMITATIRAIGEGKGAIGAVGMNDMSSHISLFIGKQQTLLLKDYERLNPISQSPVELGPDEVDTRNMEIDETESTGEQHDPFEGMTEAQIRKELEEMGYDVGESP